MDIMKGVGHFGSELLKRLVAKGRRIASRGIRIVKAAPRSPFSAKDSSKVERLEAKLEKLAEKLAGTKEVAKYYKEARWLSPLYRQGIFANSIRELGDAVKADCYISLLPSTLPAAFDLQRQFGGRVVCDNVENIDVHKHSLAPKWDPVALQMVNDLGRGALYRCDGLLTIGDALATTLKGFGRPIFVLKNFREFADPGRDNTLRAELKLPPTAILLFASGNVVVGFEPVLHALASLPEYYHLVALVRLKPESYKTAMLEKVEQLGLQQRVHFRPFVEYNALATLASGADVGLITSDISNPNGAVGLPNRCFDYLTAGLPVVAPAMPDVKALVSQYGFGQILAETSAEEWRARIHDVVDDLGTYRAKAREARSVLTWESQEGPVYEFLGRPKTVTMLGFRDLSRYQRYQRMARSLKKFGCKVNMVFFSADPDPTNLVDGVSYNVIGEQHGAGPGFRELTPSRKEAGDEA